MKIKNPKVTLAACFSCIFLTSNHQNNPKIVTFLSALMILFNTV